MPRRFKYPKHTHYAYEIKLRGKVDSVYVTCWCGKEELVALWWTAPPRGWDKTQWKYGLRWAGQLLAESVLSVAAHRPMSIKEAKDYFCEDLAFIQRNQLTLEPITKEWRALQRKHKLGFDLKNQRWRCTQKTDPKKTTWAETAVDALEDWKKRFWNIQEKK